MPSQTNSVGQELPRRSISCKFLHLVAGDFDFVLQDSGRPQHAHDVGLLRLAETDVQVRRVLAEIAGRSGDFKLLPVGAGENFDLGADGALVVGEAFRSSRSQLFLLPPSLRSRTAGPWFW